MDIQKLYDDRKAAKEAAETILATAESADREPTDEEQSEFDAQMEKFDSLTGEIKRAEDAQARRMKLAKADEALKAIPQPMTLSASAEDLSVSIPKVEPWMRHMGNLQVFGNDHEGQKKAYGFGKWLQAMTGKNPQAYSWCHQNIGAALNESINSQGGFMVPEIWSAEVIKLRDSFGLARQLCRNIPMSSEVQRVPWNTTFATVNWEGEGDTVAESTPTFQQITLTAKKAAARVLMSTEIAEDALVAVADLVAMDIATGLAEAEDDAWINGDGTNTYGGILGLRTRMASGLALQGTTDATSGDDSVDELIKSDIYLFFGKAPEYVMRGGNARFLCSTGGWVQLLSIAEGSGGSSMQDVSSGIQRQFLGYPVAVSPKMPGSGTASNDLPLMFFGDFSRGCLFGSRRGVSVRILNELYAETDQVGIIATERVDIATGHGVGDGTTAGPIVSLNGTT